MHAVVAATEDLLHFILSEKGQRVRVFLVRDIIGAADAFLQDEVGGCMFDENPEARHTLDSEVRSLSYQIFRAIIIITSEVASATPNKRFTREVTQVCMLIS